jgi:hypothetical protein
MDEGTPSEIIPLPDTAIDRAVANASAVINARIDGMEKAVGVFQADLTRVPTTVDRQILALKEKLEERFNAVEKDLSEVHKAVDARQGSVKDEISHLRDLVFGKIDSAISVTAERFSGVAAQFAERDTRTDQRAGDTKLAVDAAFAAAKEATAKIEAGFTKQIDGMITIVDTKTGNLAGGLGDLKERMTAMESRTQGIGAARAEGRETQNDSRGFIFGIVGMVIGMGALVLTVITHIQK